MSFSVFCVFNKVASWLALVRCYELPVWLNSFRHLGRRLILDH